MAKRDFYEILGVAKTASDADLKSAFRKAAMQCHPDRNPGNKDAETRFKELNEAYQHLSDPQKRAAYDRYGHAAFEQAGSGGMNDGFAASMSDIFDDLFGDIMGRRGRGSSGRERGADLRYNLEISLEDAYRGKAASIKMPTQVACEACNGSGAKAGSKPVTCKTCGGHGRVRAQQGFFAIERTCPACQGRGQAIDNPCDKCAGSGRVTRERTLSINVPAGVEDGTRIRLAGEGEAGLRGGATGDLYIFLAIKPHPFFQRDGADLYCRVPISMVHAALGGEFSVRTLDGGDAKVRIPEGAQSGRQLKLRGKGMPMLRSRDYGDLFIQTMVETPQNLTRRQRELLAEFDAEVFQQDPPGKLRILCQDEGILRGSRLRAAVCVGGRMPVRSPKSRLDRSHPRTERLLGDETQFLRKLLENPRLTGAVAPSGPFLARAMARAVGTLRDGLVVELGPGTGPVTKALIEYGVAQEKLVLVEYDPIFCRMLAQRFSPARVVQGDAYDLPRALGAYSGERIVAIVSSLPLLNQPPALRAKLIDDAFALMGATGVFVQFTYGLDSPAPRKACINKYSGQCSAPIWRNLPPARVWTYRADPKGRVVEPMLGKLRASADRLGKRLLEKREQAGRLWRKQRARVRAILTKNAKGALGAGRKRSRAAKLRPPTELAP